MTYAWDRTIVARPEHEEKVLEAVEEIRPDVRIVASRFVPEGTFFLINDEAIDVMLDPAPIVVSRSPLLSMPYLGWNFFNPDWARKIIHITGA